ncbi:MAG: UvrD-helicase domain-containing protein [Prevotella sp.]|nr:UvrD-helicase domain-containing protein [Bacteroides sp.]MCM1366819.1 UvrD-helicase domain-containing protein [Prevotella sp.]MCM1437400.1 UvrD-helicase domain-containing protein [Prevotella sp.]
MIELYKASAGSGKTYTLAQRFILYLISTKTESGKRRLRTDKEMEDSLPHILAITFTNKATNEMKERIVERLADLAGRKQYAPETDYLADFCTLLEASEDEVRHACAKALSELLINYSDFNVSTIDSFFQTVLRTFAYESDLSDNYQVEIDSEWVARVGVDATLSSINDADSDMQVRHWLNLLQQEKTGSGDRWDLFQKREGRYSAYKSMLERAKSMESEEYKERRIKLDEYFENSAKLREVYDAYDSYFNDRRESIVAKAREAANSLAEILEKFPESDNFVSGIRDIKGRIRKSVEGNFSFSYKRTANGNYIKKEGMKSLSDVTRCEINSAIEDFYSAVDAVKEEDSKTDSRLWQLYRPQLPFLALLQIIRHNSTELFTGSNVVQLSETNSIIHRVVGDDDAPFIYERIGTKLNHYLIDEFQDTSRMQWENMERLLKESESREEENLIIGDAKQSIYRFRNADPSIIRDTVPSQFPDSWLRGDKSGENRNYRSYDCIVRFNNTLFRDLAQRIDSLGVIRKKLTPLYANVVQEIQHKENEGYVQLSFVESSESKPSEGNDTTDENSYPAVLLRTIETIREILSRGYCMKDIGILVRKNSQATEMVNAILDFNRHLPPEREKERIRFISDESLKVSASEAVKIIITTLEMIEQYTSDDIEATPEPGDNNKKTVFGMASAFNFCRISHPDLDLTEVVRLFLNNTGHQDILTKLQPWLVSSTALPAVVESIIGIFVPEELRRRDAAYIAAFQDLVAEQAEKYAVDAASFLHWWRRQGIKKSIASPEGMDAVTIMTVHKAKGLAFDFVIVPELDTYVNLKKDYYSTEWRWVEPHLKPLTDGETIFTLPPYIPVEMGSRMRKYVESGLDQSAETALHADKYHEWLDSATMDNLNSVYVAFTRPVKELYIYAVLPSRGKDGTPADNGKIAKMLYDMMPEFPLNSAPDCLSPGEILYDKVDGEERFYLGKKSPGAEIEAALKRKKEAEKEAKKAELVKRGIIKPDRKETETESVTVKEYSVYQRSEPFKYREATVSSMDDEDEDPRSEGNQLHRLLSRIRIPDDLARSLRKMRLQGEADSEQLLKYKELLEPALQLAVTEYGWFLPGATVITERKILRYAEKNRIPDRIEIRDGHALVIDYKFGKEEKRYLKEVGRYCDLLRQTGQYKSVEGWIWYVKENRRVPVG